MVVHILNYLVLAALFKDLDFILCKSKIQSELFELFDRVSHRTVPALAQYVMFYLHVRGVACAYKVFIVYNPAQILY